MDLAEIRSFVSVAHRLSCTHAARELDLSQSTVSRHVQHLETELGFKLIERDTRLLAVTKAGNRFLIWAEGVLERYQVMLHDLKRGGYDSPGTISIACSTFPYEFVVPRLVVSFLAIRPAANVETTVCPSADVFAKLATGRASIGFTGTKPDTRFDYDVIASDEIVLAVPSDHPLAETAEIDLSTLSKVPFLMSAPGTGSRLTFEMALKRKKLPMPKFSTRKFFNNTETMVTAVQDGYGVGLVSLLTIQARTPQRIKTVRIKNLRMPRSLYLVSVRDSEPDAVTAAFVDWVLENRATAAGSLPEHATR